MPEYFNENLLLDDYPLVVLPKLAQAIGLDEAVVVQRLYWLFKNPRNGKTIGGKRWIYNTYAEWGEGHFPFWNQIKIKRLFLQLEKMGIVMSCQPEGTVSRRKYYRLNDGYVQMMRSGKLQIPERIKMIPSRGSNRDVPLTENTCREYIETKETENCQQFTESHSFSETRQRELKRNPRNQPYLSPEEFEEILEEENLEEIIFKRSDIYDDMARRGFHHFNPRRQKWEPIRNFRSYLIALDDKISGATTSNGLP